MSIEVIPEAFRQPFDPLSHVDHESVRLHTYGRLMSGRGMKGELQRVYSFNLHIKPELIERLINYGRFLEPYDDELDPVDEMFTRTRTFNTGMALALAATANLAFELGINQFEWRQQWVELPEGVDAPVPVVLEEASTPDDCFKVGAALIDIGHRTLTQLEAPYQALLEDVNTAHPTLTAHNNIFRASYGYVLGISRRVIRDIAHERSIEKEVATSMPSDEDMKRRTKLDDEYERLIREEEV